MVTVKFSAENIYKTSKQLAILPVVVLDCSGSKRVSVAFGWLCGMLGLSVEWGSSEE